MTLDPAAVEQPRGPMFTIITKALSGTPDPESGRRRFRATASSTIVDQKGDEIQLKALEQLAEQFRRGIGVFMDHDRSTGSAFGVTDGAEIIQRGMDERTNTPVWDLDIMGIVNTPNPRAAQLADSIDGGYVKLGASVTAWVRKHLKKPGGGMLISDLDAIEVSIVGVPENQRSWAQKAALAVKGFYSNTEEDPLVADNETNVEATSAETPDDAGAEPGTPEAPVEMTPLPGDEPVKTGHDAAAPAASDSSDQESAEESADKAETPAGETPETASAEQSADTPIVEKAFEPGEVKELIGHVTNLVARIGDLENQIIEKDATIARYVSEAGSIAKEVDQASQVIEKVLSAPLRSKTAGYVDELISKSSIWSEVSPSIAEYLNKRKHLT